MAITCTGVSQRTVFAAPIGRTYRQIFRQLQLLSRLPNSLEKQLESEIEDQASHHHDRDKPYDLGANHHDAERQDGKLDAGQTTIPA